MRRPRTSLFLFISGITLLVAIYLGERMGEHVLRRTTETTAIVPEATTPTPQPTVGQSGPIVDWRRLQVVTVATDPGFPDPRVTKPTPTPTPKPTPPPTPPPTPTPLLGSPTPAPSVSANSQGIPSYAAPTPPPGFAPPPPGGG
jgi:hypothetical protein